MQSQRLRDTLEALRRQSGYVVIEAPSTSSSADAQSLASLADAAILAVELRRAKRPALLDAAEQLSRVGTPLLGAVVLPRLNPMRTDEVNLPVVTLPAERRPEPRPVQRPEQHNGQRAEERRGPRDAAGLDPDQTQQMRRVPGGLAPGGPVRPRPSDLDEVTAIIDLGPASAQPRAAEKAGEQPDEK
jgi:hypothetical protein